MLFGLSIAFSWVLWCIIDFYELRQLSGGTLVLELLKEFGEQVIETSVLLCLSLFYIKLIVKAFWNKEKNIRNLIIQVIMLAVLNGISSLLSATVYSLIYPLKKELFAKIAYTDYLNLSVLTTAYLVNFIVNRYRDEAVSHLEAEKKLKEEESIALQAKLNNLSLRTNNHFVFNCFSTLAGLIKTDADNAEIFLQEMSGLYRYLVMNGAKSIVPIKEELTLVNHYIKLVNYRYTGISFNIAPSLSNLKGFICPVALQSLVENAVKHNRHGKDNQLKIEINTDGDYISVSNNILPREDSVPGTGKGLSNLKDRYSLLTDKKVLIKNDTDNFEVRLPILYLENIAHESIDY